MATTGGLALSTMIHTATGDQAFDSFNDGDWVFNRHSQPVQIWFDPVGLMKNPYKVEFPSRSSPMRATDFYVADASHPLVLYTTKTTSPKLQEATDGQYRKLVWLSACVPVQSGRVRSGRVQSGRALAAEELEYAAVNKQEYLRRARGLRDGAQPPPLQYDFDVKGRDPNYDLQLAPSSTNGLSSEAWLNDDAHDSDVDLIGWLRDRACDCGGVRNLSFSFSKARSAAQFLEGALSPIATEYIEPQLLSVGNEVHMTIDPCPFVKSEQMKATGGRGIDEMPLHPYFFGAWLGDGFHNAPTICGVKEEVEMIHFLRQMTKDLDESPFRLPDVEDLKVSVYEETANRDKPMLYMSIVSTGKGSKVWTPVRHGLQDHGVLGNNKINGVPNVYNGEGRCA